MAPGSQKWKGTIADLVIAPTSSSTTEAVTSGPASGGWAIRALIE